MMRKSSFRPVPRLMWETEGLVGALETSGVHSKIQATIRPRKTEQEGNKPPIGRPGRNAKKGKTPVATWIRSQATTP